MRGTKWLGGPVTGALILASLVMSADADEALTARNREIVRDFYTTVLIGRNVDAAPRFLSEGYIQHSAGIPSGVKGFMDTFRKAFAQKQLPDYERDIVRIVAENDIVIVFDRQSATHPNGWHHVVLQFDMFRVKDGKIVEHWDADPGSTV